MPPPHSAGPRFSHGPWGSLGLPGAPGCTAVRKPCWGLGPQRGGRSFFTLKRTAGSPFRWDKEKPLAFRGVRRWGRSPPGLPSAGWVNTGPYEALGNGAARLTSPGGRWRGSLHCSSWVGLRSGEKAGLGLRPSGCTPESLWDLEQVTSL